MNVMKRFLSLIFAFIAVISVFLPTLTASASTVEDIIGEEPVSGDKTEIVSLEDKTILIVGNSMVYYGNCVIYGNQGNSDYGYFYQIISSNEENATVLNYTYPGKTLAYIYENHLRGLSAEICNEVDYVVMSESTHENENLAEDCIQIMELFQNAEGFSFMCHPIMYEKNTESLLNGVSQLREMGVKIVEWGKLVYDIYTGEVEVPYSSEAYDRCSFIKDNLGYENGKDSVGGSKEGDDKHPNPLSGYIASQMLYTAITNRSALYSDYSFCNDNGLHKYFDFEAFIAAHYNGDKTTNFDRIFQSPNDMVGLQTLINEYNESEGRHCLAVAERVDPTCTSAGLGEGGYCDVCGEIFIPQEIIESKGGHTIVYDEAVAPTCTVAGKTSGAHCLECGEALIPQRIVDAVGHTPVTDIVTATSSKNGSRITSCSVCGEELDVKAINKVKSVTLSKTDYTYSGKQKTPTVTVTDNKGAKLVEGTDYTVKFLQSTRKNPGYYEVQVIFMGDYSGTKTLGFTIAPNKTTGLKATKTTTTTVTLSWDKMKGASGYVVYKYYPSTKTYKKLKTVTGTTLTVKDRKSGTKYYYAVKAYTNSETGKIYGSYSKVLTTSTKPSKPTITLKAGIDKATVSWKKVSGASGYEIQYSTSSKMKNVKKVTVKKGSTLKKTIKSLKTGKKYYIKVRAYKTVNSKKVYSSWSKVKNVKVK